VKKIGSFRVADRQGGDGRSSASRGVRWDTDADKIGENLIAPGRGSIIPPLLPLDEHVAE